MVKLSLCIPTYNNPKLIEASIENLEDVLEWIDYEILVLNDGTDDETPHICANAIANNQKINYIKPIDNLWVTKAWNELADSARGEYISIINDDVVFPKWFYHKIIKAIDEETRDDIMMYNPRFREEREDYPIQYYGNHICGHCFTFRAIHKNKLFPIPEVFKIFGNDNRLWHKINDLWYNQRIVHDAIAFHLKSQTVKNIPNTDVQPYKDMCEEMWWTIPTVYPLPEDDLDYNKVI